MSDSVFTKIIRAEIPCHKVYEDAHTFAFMDIHPIQPGQVLLVTKNPAESILDLPDDDYTALWAAARRIAAKMKQVFPDKKRIGFMVEGLEVPHTHVKIFPINTGEEYRAHPNMAAQPNHKELAEMAAKLAF